VGSRAGLDRWGKISPPTGIRSPDRPARSQSLYRLRYPAHNIAHRYQKSLLLSLVLRVSEVTFVTNVSWTSVIGQAMKGVLLPLGQTGLIRPCIIPMNSYSRVQNPSG